ncbi:MULTISPECIES: aminotransferase class I/II-fold pyridoxal phosphate-dependent enzyme [Vibrio]|uniref:aminotransferase class I/II-fold pyridoxal phosphate-dependent enzyme n=1 Tax=Vibrio TaxID=662 RepID=UPI003D0DA704
MSIFEDLANSEIDEVAQLSNMIRLDKRLDIHNLVSGTLLDDEGMPFTLPTVLKCINKHVRSWDVDRTESLYHCRRFASLVTSLVFGHAFAQENAAKLVTVRTLGGTGALRLALDFYSKKLCGKNIWVGFPCWDNYHFTATAAGLDVRYFHYQGSIDHWSQHLKNAQPNDAILIQSGAYNPTGTMFSSEQWRAIATLCLQKRLIPILDNACQGVGKGVWEDSEGIRILSTYCPNLLVVTSFSKNFTLYNEQVGALSIKLEASSQVELVERALCSIQRTSYSSAPQLGASIVSLILGDTKLFTEWCSDLGDVRCALDKRKNRFLGEISKEKIKPTFQTNGLFFQLNLDKRVIGLLRKVDGIYLLDGGRVSLAGISLSRTTEIAAQINRRCIENS